MPLTQSASLPAIAALVRAGAHVQAWDMFAAAGHDRRSDDPAALPLLGRLLKERARHGSRPARSGLLRQAAEAYARANAIEPAPYLAINVATLRLLAGEPALARAAATEVLALIDAPQPPAETPYYLAAIRAEALLLLGDDDGARAAMRVAVAADPDGWDDRATTVRQLGEIASARGRSIPWLDDFRPPASLHFAGHMALVPGGPGEVSLAARIDEILSIDRIGFGFGTAAAGSDIVIAERLLAAGGELVLILPCEPELFERQSVAPAGETWTARYRDLLGQAAGVIAANPAGPGSFPADLHDPLATQLAGRMAIGEALLKARHLATYAYQAIAFDPAGGGAHSRALAAQWPSPPSQRRLKIPREVEVRSVFAGDIADPARRLVSVVSLLLDLDGLDEGAVRTACAPVWKALAAVPAERIAADWRGWDVIADEPAEAAEIAIRVLAAAREAGSALPSAGLACGIASLQTDEISGNTVARGPVMPQARRMANGSQPGTAFTTSAFALALTAQGQTGTRCELAHTGEGEAGDEVYLLLSED